MTAVWRYNTDSSQSWTETQNVNPLPVQQSPGQRV